MKKFSYLLLMIAILIFPTGCLKNDSMEDITIRATIYPSQYITERLYGKHSKIASIYPNGSTQEEVVSDKLLQDYSQADLFIFNGNNEEEMNYVYKMRNYHNNLKLIDASSSMVFEHSVEELWLDPMNLLTMANSIKKGFEEYTKSAYLTNEIAENYQALKQDLIQLDADYRDMAKTANKNTIVVSNDAFLYLEKYGITVISLEENENLTQKNIYTVTDMIKKGDISYIYTVKGEKVNKTITSIQKETNVELIELHNLYTRTEEEATKGEDYLSLMKNNLEALKKQLYN